MCRILEELKSSQRALHAEQERLTESLLLAQLEAAEEMRKRVAGAENTQEAAQSSGFVAPSSNGARGLLPAKRANDVDGAQDEPLPDSIGSKKGPLLETRHIREHMAKHIKRFEEHEEELDFWRKTSGLHTVDRWVLDYRSHPGAWGSLLMIHGVAELTSRLRTKVENSALYASLFLSMSIALLADPPDRMLEPCEDGDWGCHVQKKCFLWGFTVGTVVHILCIALAMSFVNALNETARDSDVYRMLAAGEGFMATMKCQHAFKLGCLADMISVAAATASYGVPWQELLIGCSCLVLWCGAVFFRSSSLLFSTGSLVNYWREELGGNPDANDPYDIYTPARCFYEKAYMNDAVWEPKGERFHQRIGRVAEDSEDERP